MTEKELQSYLLKHYPKEDIDCDWKEMTNLKNNARMTYTIASPHEANLREG